MLSEIDALERDRGENLTRDCATLCNGLLLCVPLHLDCPRCSSCDMTTATMIRHTGLNEAHASTYPPCCMRAAGAIP